MYLYRSVGCFGGYCVRFLFYVQITLVDFIFWVRKRSSRLGIFRRNAHVSFELADVYLVNASSHVTRCFRAADVVVGSTHPHVLVTRKKSTCSGHLGVSHLSSDNNSIPQSHPFLDTPHPPIDPTNPIPLFALQR